jgi:hypothetical protein
LALPGQKHAWRRVGRSFCGLFRNLWRSPLCLQKLGKPQGIPVFHSSRAAAAITASIPALLLFSTRNKSSGSPTSLRFRRFLVACRASGRNPGVRFGMASIGGQNGLQFKTKLCASGGDLVFCHLISPRFFGVLCSRLLMDSPQNLRTLKKSFRMSGRRLVCPLFFGRTTSAGKRARRESSDER